MAYDKVVDSAKLNAEMTAVADAIRDRAGIKEKLEFPSEYESAIKGIPDYGEQMVNGSIGYYKNETITGLRTSGFANCKLLTRIIIPNVKTLSAYCFQNCSILVTVDCPATLVQGSCFFNNGQLANLLIRSTSMATLENTSAFTNSAIAYGTGHIYVPRALLSDTDSTKDYRRATNWSTYATQFRALEDYTVDGTITGEFDYVSAGFVKIVFDGTQNISIPDWSINPSGVNGCTHFEYVLPSSTNVNRAILPPFIRRVNNLDDAVNVGVPNICHFGTYNGKKYLVVSMDSNLLGTTVDSIKSYLATHNLVFYIKT